MSGFAIISRVREPLLLTAFFGSVSGGSAPPWKRRQPAGCESQDCLPGVCLQKPFLNFMLRLSTKRTTGLSCKHHAVSKNVAVACTVICNRCATLIRVWNRLGRRLISKGREVFSTHRPPALDCSDKKQCSTRVYPTPSYTDINDSNQPLHLRYIRHHWFPKAFYLEP